MQPTNELISNFLENNVCDCPDCALCYRHEPEKALEELIAKATAGAVKKERKNILQELRAIIDHNLVPDEGTVDYDGVTEELMAYLHNKEALGAEQ